MSTIAPPEVSSAMKPVASWHHTAVLISIFLGLSLSGALFQRHARTHPQDLHSTHILLIYLSLIAMECGLFAYVKGGLARYHLDIKRLIGGKWGSPKDILRDAGLALGLWIVWLGVEAIWRHVFPVNHAASIQTSLPRKPEEILLWIIVSVCAGISEEIAFRGYFQQQFAAFTGSKWIALCLQAVLFGIGHGYEGLQATAEIAVFGAMFGMLAIWRDSLRPGIITHAWTDIMSGICGI